MPAEGYTEIKCWRKHETEAAVCILYNSVEYWLPLSQVRRMSFDASGKGTVEVRTWLAEQRGIG